MAATSSAGMARRTVAGMARTIVIVAPNRGGVVREVATPCSQGYYGSHCVRTTYACYRSPDVIGAGLASMGRRLSLDHCVRAGDRREHHQERTRLQRKHLLSIGTNRHHTGVFS